VVNPPADLHAQANAPGGRVHLRPTENVAQFIFGVFENKLLFLGQIRAGAIDVEIQHRHR
jgi:hypothetical protein